MSHPPRLIHADAVAPQPWRNGGGRTRELLTWPASGAWSLRLSLADIEADGPFSAFPGIRRWFAVIEGAGVVLRFGETEKRLVPGDAPLAFDGGEAPDCRLIDGATRDLNLMIRGGSGSMVSVAPGVERAAAGAQCGLFAAVAGRWSCADGSGGQVPARTLVWFEEALQERLVFVPEAVEVGRSAGWWVSFLPQPQLG